MISEQFHNGMLSNQMDEADDSDNDSSLAFSSKSKTVHSLVEKKRRDKMTQYVSDLSNMIPMCGVMQRKLDKITVLRMAVQHLKAIKGSKVKSDVSETGSSPSVVNENMMKTILESADCFLFVVACDRGKFLYVSESVTSFIECHHTELIGQSVFDILHPKDVAKVKEQLVALDVTAREVFIDAKTMEPVNPGVIPKEEPHISSSGAARSFFCRMKNRLSPAVIKSEPDAFQDQCKKKRPVHVYVSLHCTGFLKTWASSKVSNDANTDQAEASCNLACLVAVARLVPRLTQTDLDSVGHLNMKPVQFYARLNYEYKFSFVEPMVTYVTGFLPQELVGNTVFDLFTDDDGAQLKELLYMTTKSDEKIVSPVLNIQTVNDSSICVRVVLSVFKNPLTSEFEHTLLDITAVASYTKSSPIPIRTEECVDATMMTTDNAAVARANTSSTHTASNSGAPFSGSYDGDEEMNAEVSRAMMMSVLGPDGGLGTNIEPNSLSWPFTS